MDVIDQKSTPSFLICRPPWGIDFHRGRGSKIVMSFSLKVILYPVSLFSLSWSCQFGLVLCTLRFLCWVQTEIRLVEAMSSCDDNYE